MLYNETPEGVTIFGEDLTDVERYLASAPRVWNHHASRTEAATPRWSLGVGMDEALRLAKTGWSDGAIALGVAVEAIEPERVLAELKFDFGGERVDVPRFLGGSPDCMIAKGRSHKPNPVLHLVVNGSASCGVSAKAIAAYGAAMVAVVDRIENAGRRVELDVAFCIQSGGARIIPGWKVKRAEDHLDLSAVAYSIQHPAAWRRLGFALIERAPRKWETSSYGMPSVLRKSDLASFNASDAFILPGIGEQHGDLNPAAMVNFAARQVNDASGEEILRVA